MSAPESEPTGPEAQRKGAKPRAKLEEAEGEAAALESRKARLAELV